MDRIAVKNVDIGDGYRDGQHVVQAWDGQGREYTLMLEDTGIACFTLTGAMKMAAKVKERGSIDPAHWSCRIPYGSAAWLLDGMEERIIEDEKAGLL